MTKAETNFVTVVIVGCVIYFVAKSGIDNLLKFLEITIWPLVIFVCLMAFKRIFTYIFFSLHEFNFFGLKGKLEPVETMIKRKAGEFRAKEKDDEQRVKEQLAFQSELDKLKHANTDLAERNKKIIDLAERIFKQYKESSSTKEEKTIEYKTE